MLIYELYIDKFAGTIGNLITKLDYLHELGMEALWILPHYPSPLVDDGYDVSDYKNVRADLGTLDDFHLLTKAAHELGMKIIIDLPINHTSTDHPWFKEARGSLNNDKRDYYLWSQSGADMLTAVNAFPNAKLTNWVYNPFTKDYYFATFYPLQPDLNWDNPQVLKEFFEIIDFWLDLGVDGFRLDAVTHIIKRKHSLSLALPETHNVVTAIRKHIDSRTKDIMIMGEADLPTLHATDYFGPNKNECTTLINFEDSLLFWLYLLDGDENVLKKIISNSDFSRKRGEWVYFLGMHDSFPLGVLPTDLQQRLKNKLDPSGIYENKHDKRIALRTAEIWKGNQEKIVKAFKLFLEFEGHKVIYYGDEIGTMNVSTEEFLIDNRHEIRAPFNWEEMEKQKKSANSLFNQLKTLFVAKSIQS